MRKSILLLGLITLLFVGATIIQAATGKALFKQRFASQGTTQQAIAGNKSLRGTLGQPFVSMDTQGNKTLCAGIWCGFGEEHLVYLPLVLR